MAKWHPLPTDPEDVKTWLELLTITCAKTGENVDELVCTLSQEELHFPFNAGFTGSMGKNFTAWGKNWVYFPLAYDNMTWVGHAPRNPGEIAMPCQYRPNWTGSI